MATLLLVRHGRTTANASGVLAGRTPGVELDEIGRAQARSTGERLAPVPLVGVVTSPMLRCEQTTQAILDARSSNPGVWTDAALTECDYGQWQGLTLNDLVKDDLWPIVQRQPSAVTFPGGESMAAMQARAVTAVRQRDAAFEAEHGPGAVWVAVSHGDLVKALLADATGSGLAHFQRYTADPASVSAIRYGGRHTFLLAANEITPDLQRFVPAPDAPPTGDAQVGGGAG